MALMYRHDFARRKAASVVLKSPTIGSTLVEQYCKTFGPHLRGMRTQWAGSTPGSHYYNFGPAPFDFNAQPHTILFAYWPISHTTASPNYARLFQVNNNTTTVAYLLLQQLDATYTNCLRLDSYGTTTKSKITTNNAYTLLTPVTTVVTNEIGTAHSTFRIFINGIESAYNSTGNTDGSGLLTATGDVVVGNTSVSAQDTQLRQSDAVIPLILVWNRILTDSEIREISENPYQIFGDTSDTFAYVTGVSSGSSIDLTVAEAIHTHTVDTPTLTTEQYLAILETVHSHNVDNLVLTTDTDVTLTIAEALHTHSVDNVLLATDWLLSISDSAHTHICDNVVLDISDATNLILANALHSHQAESIILTLASWLSVVSASHLHTADSLQLSLNSFLAIQDTAQQHKVDNCSLNTGGGGLTIEEILAAVKADPMILTIPKWLVLRDIM